MVEADTICAIATGPGEAAIGIVRLSGPTAKRLLGAVCGRSKLAPRRLTLARIRDPRTGLLLDQAMICYLPGPRSYTGEDMAEVQAHGGRLNLQRLLQLFLDLGARAAAPGEFTRRAFLNGRLDLSQAEAVAEVIRAGSERELRNAQALLEGGLRRRLGPLRQEILELTAVMEASIDFAEEISSEPEREAAAGRALRLAAELEGMAGSYVMGRRLRGVRVGLLGEVNAGKSTLFNALLGSARALVSDEPGTTRDYIEEEASWGGQRVELVDSAGWRPAAEQSALERAGSALAAPALQRCDLLLEVLDLSSGPSPTPPGERWPGLSGVPWLAVGTKLDLVPKTRRGALAASGLTLVSALSGEGVPDLRALIVERLFCSSSDEELFVTEERQWRALGEAAGALGEAAGALQKELGAELVTEHLREALRALGRITGETFSESVLEEVFRRFCLGK